MELEVFSDSSVQNDQAPDESLYGAGPASLAAAILPHPAQSTEDVQSEHSEQSEQGEQGKQEAQNELSAYLANEYDYQAPVRGDIRTGTVVEETDYGLLVDIGFKREGIVPVNDLERLDDETRAQIQVGSEVSVFVLRPENREGQPVLSIHQARVYEDWIKAEELMKSGEVYEGVVSGCNRGGLIVKFGKIRGFVPASQITGFPRRMKEDQRRERLESMVGETIGLKIIEVDRRRRRLIFSQRRAMNAWQDMQRDRVMAELTEGEIRHGRVTSLTDFGAFVDLGGADGLIHVSEMSWGRVENPREILKVGDEIDVYVLKVDQKKKRIGLSLKKLQPDPWSVVDERYQKGQLVEGKVTRVLDFGAFVEIEGGLEGLLHATEMIGTPELKPSDLVEAGESLLVKIIHIDSNRRRLGLSTRQVSRGEWERWVTQQRQAEVEAMRASVEPVEAEEETKEEVKEEAEKAVVEAVAVSEGATETALESVESEDLTSDEPSADAEEAKPEPVLVMETETAAEEEVEETTTELEIETVEIP